MASGDILLRTGSMMVVRLLDAVAATSTNNGVWIDCEDYMVGSVVTTGATGAAVTDVRAFNDAGLAAPSNATAGVAIATAGAATDIQVQITALPRWLKASIPTLGTGTVTSIAVLRRGF